MSRSKWAAAVVVSVFTFALTPLAALAASHGSAAHASRVPAKPASHPGSTISRRRAARSTIADHARFISFVAVVVTPVHKPPPLARAITGTPRRVSVLLTPGSGYQQAAGLRRVRVLQRRLAGLGFAPGPIDGRYGPLTTQAVKRFQGARRLTIDGIVGSQTLTALDAVAGAGLLPGAGYQQPAGLGRVRVLQRRLAGLGFAPGPIDGRYGPRTTLAVKRFQRSHHLAASGIVGASTLRALRTGRRGIRSSRPKSRPVFQSPPGSRTHRSPVAVSGPPNRQHKHSPLLPVILVVLGLMALGLLTIAVNYVRARVRARRSYALFITRLAHGHSAQAAEPRIIPIGSREILPFLEDHPAPELHPVPEVEATPEVDAVLEVDAVPEAHPIREVHPVLLTGSALARRERESSAGPPVPPILAGLLALGLAVIARTFGRTRGKRGGRPR